MCSKHRKTLEAMFNNPVNRNIEWSRIEALLVAVGCTVVEGSGSSVTFEKQGNILQNPFIFLTNRFLVNLFVFLMHPLRLRLQSHESKNYLVVGVSHHTALRALQKPV